MPAMSRTRCSAFWIVPMLSATSALAQTVPGAHFHHLHLNATDPKAAIEFYTSKFDAEKARLQAGEAFHFFRRRRIASVFGRAARGEDHGDIGWVGRAGDGVVAHGVSLV